MNFKTKSEMHRFMIRTGGHELFTHSKYGSIDITEIREVIAKYTKLFDIAEVEGTVEIVRELAQYRDVDPVRVRELTPEEIEEPGIAVILPEEMGGGIDTIDGHHRMMRRLMDGKPKLYFYIMPLAALEHFRPKERDGYVGVITSYEGKKEFVDGKLVDRT